MQNAFAPNIVESSERNRLLDGMGLSETIFEQAMLEGLHQLKKTTKLHPRTTAGSRAWEEIVASLREQLLSLNNGWEYDHKNGLSLTYNSSLGVTIVSTSGDKNTGLSIGIDPKTKNSKGAETQRYVGRNYDLFSDDMGINSSQETTRIDSMQTWVLLHCIDHTAKEIRYELSLPTGTALAASKGKVKIDSWEKRIILGSVSFNDTSKLLEQPEFTEAVNFEVTKKAQ